MDRGKAVDLEAEMRGTGCALGVSNPPDSGPWTDVFGRRTKAPNQIERCVGRPVPGLAPGASIKAPLRGLGTQTSNRQGAGWAIDPGVDGMGQY